MLFYTHIKYNFLNDKGFLFFPFLHYLEFNFLKKCLFCDKALFGIHLFSINIYSRNPVFKRNRKVHMHVILTFIQAV